MLFFLRSFHNNWVSFAYSKQVNYIRRYIRHNTYKSAHSEWAPNWAPINTTKQSDSVSQYYVRTNQIQFGPFRIIQHTTTTNNCYTTCMYILYRRLTGSDTENILRNNSTVCTLLKMLYNIYIWLIFNERCEFINHNRTQLPADVTSVPRHNKIIQYFYIFVFFYLTIWNILEHADTN